MSYVFDAPLATYRIKCANCSTIFESRYIDKRFCTVQCKDSAAKKRKRSRDKLLKEGLGPIPATVSTPMHPAAQAAFKRRVVDELASPRLQWQATFVATHARLPEEHEFPEELQCKDEGHHSSATEEAVRAVLSETDK